MESNRAKIIIVLSLLVAVLPPVPLGFGDVTAANAQVHGDDPAFQEVWSRTDALVQSTRVKRSFYWGYSLGQPMYERYDDGSGGRHFVQYFEKSRMEINDPNASRSNPFYVTNGQLAKELITGRVQVGRANFVQLPPAEVAIASDTSDRGPGTPTYASFGSAIRPNPNAVGEAVTSTINRSGQVGTDQSYFNDYRVRYAYYEPATQNNIPDLFWDFLNATGPIIVNNRQVTARLSDPYFYATGYPISAAYWARVTIAGKPNTAVLVQAYERRVLTYVPSAPEGWRVQMGNVGLHYLEWRYRWAWVTGQRSCQAPGGKTGALWFARPDVQQWMGCPSPEQVEQGMTVAHQTFERGQMLDLIGRELRIIYVLFENGTAQGYRDTYVGSSPEPNLNPPPGLYAPVRGFGKVWREANLSERLGWATAPESVATYDPGPGEYPPTPVPTEVPVLRTPSPSPGPLTPVPATPKDIPAVRSFGPLGLFSNMIVYTGPTLRKLYVIYQSGTRWMVFDDVY